MNPPSIPTVQKAGLSGCARRGNFVLFCGCDWTAREELTLLEAIEHFGLGNWEDISKMIGTRSPGEAFLHYEEAYVNSNIASHSMKDDQLGSVIDHTMIMNEECDSGIVPTVHASRSPKESSTTEQQNQLAYLPLRDDFELDHDNTAEIDIADLNPFGDPGVYNLTTNCLEFDLKVAQIHMFRRRLRERHRRHAIVHEYSLVNNFFQSKSSEKLPSVYSNGTCKTDNLPCSRVSASGSDEKKQPNSANNGSVPSEQSVELDLEQLKGSLIPFLQTISQRECTSLLQTLFKEQQVKTQIASLQYFRKRGCRTLSDCNDLVCDKTEDLPSFLIPFTKSLQNEVSNRPGKKFSEASSQKSCENGHFMLSNVEKKFCDTNDINKELYMSVKFNVIKKIGDGMTMNEIKCKTISRNSSTNVQTLIADFLQESGLISV